MEVVPRAMNKNTNLRNSNIIGFKDMYSLIKFVYNCTVEVALSVKAAAHSLM